MDKLKFPAHPGIDGMGHVVTPDDVGIVVELNPEVFVGQDIHIGAHHRKVLFSWVVEIKGATALAKAGVQPTAIVGELVLVGGVGLGHHRHRAPL